MKKELSHMVIGVLCIVILWLLSFLIISYKIPILSDRGSFGDTFGAVNSLFSGLAFLGIIYTIFLQRTELQLQRQELKMTRNELKKSAEAQEKQVDIQINVAKLTAYAALLESANKTKRSDISTTIDFFGHSGNKIEEDIKNILNMLNK